MCQVCEVSDQKPATWRCDEGDCSHFLCEECNVDEHSSKKTKDHVRTPVGSRFEQDKFQEEADLQETNVSGGGAEEQFGGFEEEHNSHPVQAVALYAYAAADDEDVSFEKGDEFVDVEDAEEEEWLKGTVVRTGASGTFPANYVQFEDGAAVGAPQDLHTSLSLAEEQFSGFEESEAGDPEPAGSIQEVETTDAADAKIHARVQKCEFGCGFGSPTEGEVEMHEMTCALNPAKKMKKKKKKRPQESGTELQKKMSKKVSKKTAKAKTCQHPDCKLCYRMRVPSRTLHTHCWPAFVLLFVFFFFIYIFFFKIIETDACVKCTNVSLHTPFFILR